MGLPDETRVTILLKQYELVSAVIRGVQSSQDKVANFALLVLGAGLAYGVAGPEHNPYVFLALPFPLLALYLYSFHLITLVNALGGHKEAIELAMKDCCAKERLLFWELTASKVHKHSVSVAVMNLVYLYFVVAATLLSVYSAAITLHSSFWTSVVL